jgi:hypothetical protein
MKTWTSDGITKYAVGGLWDSDTETRLTSLIAVVCAHRLHLAYHTHQNLPKTSLIMVSTPPLNFDHKKGFEIPIKHKEAIHQLY